MAEGYHTNNKTPQGVANVEVILFNHLMQGRLKEQTEQWKRQIKQWKEQTEQWKGQIEQWKGFYFPLNGKLKDLQLKDCCHELCRKPLARNDRFCFQNSKNGIWKF
jgi:hypothetical protein